MPGSIAQASPGGTSPRTDEINLVVLTTLNFEKGEPVQGPGEETIEPIEEDQGQQHHPLQEEGTGGHHQHAHHEVGEETEKVVQSACRDGMPGSIAGVNI